MKGKRTKHRGRREVHTGEKQAYAGPIERLDETRWRIPRSYREDMRVDGIIYADDALIAGILSDRSPEQVANVACLPGIVGHSLAMPDIHWGYGFCIGGVAATDPEQGGVISPGGVGYDINCGVRLLTTNIEHRSVGKDRMQRLVDEMFKTVPCGVGRGGALNLGERDMRAVLERGAPAVVDMGFGTSRDVEVTEARGCLDGADPDAVSQRAKDRGKKQCGTLGSGNHFMEVQVVERVFDAEAARILGLEIGTLTVMIHSGSRGLGYQVCDDSLGALRGVPEKYGIRLPDRQLACAPVHSPEGRRYLGAMRAAANYAWANRQVLTFLAREAFCRVFETSAENLDLRLVYDVAHNIAKMEPYDMDGETKTLCVHRKGATRAFPPGHGEVPGEYRAIGQPVLIPGDMGRASYVLVGRDGAMAHTFGSCCHGAGRRMSRSAAVRAAKGRSIQKELRARGVIARARGRHGLDEEQPDAYKDVSNVVEVVERAGIAARVCRLRPVGVIKG